MREGDNKKLCTWCGELKPLSDYTYRKDRNVYVSYCKECFRNYSNKRSEKKNKERDRLNRNFVYKILDKNGEILYIGKTNDLKRRILSHMGADGHLPDEFKLAAYKVEYICLKSKIECDLRELYYIDYYKPKYNTQYSYDEDSLDISLPKLLWNEVLIEDICNFKLSKSKYSIDYIVEYAKNYPNERDKVVVQLDKDTYQIVGIYDSGTQASKFTGIDDGTIYKVLTKQRHTAGGYIWQKLSEYIEKS